VVRWRWRRRLFQWKEKLLDVCNGLVLGAADLGGGEDRWKWGKSEYSVKEAYLYLSEDDDETVDWVKDVWNLLVPLKISVLVRRLIQNRLPTKDKLCERGVHLKSSVYCVGGCGRLESSTHVFFNCLVLSVCWSEALKWLGVSAAFVEGGLEHLHLFKGLV
ncbi:receptor-like kinase, partial [Trifolium medium]|nr:receptor-like kinase [Trifolium medium]